MRASHAPLTIVDAAWDPGQADITLPARKTDHIVRDSSGRTGYTVGGPSTSHPHFTARAVTRLPSWDVNAV
jgi:hypothetical protein